MQIAIMDTGCANLASVSFAFERLGAVAQITSEAGALLAADRVILPGVGAAPFALAEIKAKGLDTITRQITRPLLGICLGMQLLYETLEEGGEVIDGLGLIPGHVKNLDTKGKPTPHMGWNQLEALAPHDLLSGIKPGDYAYFVHSYAAPVSETTLAQTRYGTPFTAITGRGNIYGCQFHPERSSDVGAKILSNFLELPA